MAPGLPSTPFLTAFGPALAPCWLLPPRGVEREQSQVNPRAWDTSMHPSDSQDLPGDPDSGDRCSTQGPVAQGWRVLTNPPYTGRGLSQRQFESEPWKNLTFPLGPWVVGRGEPGAALSGPFPAPGGRGRVLAPAMGQHWAPMPPLGLFFQPLVIVVR